MIVTLHFLPMKWKVEDSTHFQQGGKKMLRNSHKWAIFIGLPIVDVYSLVILYFLNLFSDPWLRDKKSTCFACGRVVMDWTSQNKDDSSYHFDKFCPKLKPNIWQNDNNSIQEEYLFVVYKRFHSFHKFVRTNCTDWHDLAFALVSSLPVLFGIVGTVILLKQRCKHQGYGLYLAGLIAYFLSYEFVRYFL